MTQEQRYKEYISSSAWKKLRLKFIEGNYNKDRDRSNGDTARCFMCDDCQWNYRQDELEVHHIHYYTLGAESRSDVDVLCKNCHPKADKERKIKVRERNAQILEDARYLGFLKKKYGEDYPFDELDHEIEHEKFYEWRERVESI